jgi:hypothetical protein
LQRFSVEQARAVLAEYHQSLSQLDPLLFQRAAREVCSGHSGQIASHLMGANPPFRLERTLREQYIERYGVSSVPLPECLENSALLMALRLSPRYMPQGVREGAEELFKDPAFLAGVATSLVVYLIAWAAPEPVFSKAFAASVTAVLALTFTLAELSHFGMVALRVYQDTRDVQLLSEVELAAERFGGYLGGAGLRVLAYVACRGVAKNVQVPQGGVWGALLPRRFALPGGFSWGMITSARAVPANATLVVAGVSGGAAGAALRSACIDLSSKLPGYSRHHLATNKNELSNAQGGPWTPVFQLLFDRAGLSLDDAANKVNLLGHQGPHPEEYHLEIHDRLRRALGSCKAREQCRALLLAELKKIAQEVCTSGSRLHRLATK